jgi:catechol 2,3-dioxygenase-like lactoylglutathione lyase family enzyme
VRLNHVTLGVTDITRSVDFYKRLGLHQIVGGSNERYARFEVPEGDSTLSLSSDPEHGARPGSGPSIHFESDRLDELVAELETAGFEFDQQPTDMPYGWREAILRDPDGNVIFLYHAGEMRLNPPWRLP